MPKMLRLYLLLIMTIIMTSYKMVSLHPITTTAQISTNTKAFVVSTESTIEKQFKEMVMNGTDPNTRVLIDTLSPQEAETYHLSGQLPERTRLRLEEYLNKFKIIINGTETYPQLLKDPVIVDEDKTD